MSGSGRRTHYRKHLTDSVLNDFPVPLEQERIAKVVGTRGSNQFEIVVASTRSLLPKIDVKDTTKCTSGRNIKKDSQSIESPETQTFLLGKNRQVELAILPTKFRKLVWLKRNDFVICECANDDEATSTSPNKNQNGGIRFMIKHILYKDQVKHLKQLDLWPDDDYFAEDVERRSDNNSPESAFGKLSLDTESTEKNETDELDIDGAKLELDDGIVYNQKYLDCCNVTINEDIDEYFINSNRISKLAIDDSSSDENSD